MAPKTPARDLRAATPLGVARLRLGLAPAPLIALTRDARLVVTLKKVTDPTHPVLPVSTEIDLANALLAHQGGVAVIDCAAVSSAVNKLIDRLHAQFPELVLIVAGSAKEQGILATQITDGSVHRFLHRPVSEQRVRLFVEAAWRRHAEDGALPPAAPAPRPPRRGRAALILLGLAVLVGVAVPLAWLALRPPSEAPHAVAVPATRVGSDDAALESLLARADRALAAGALVAPPTENAAELYREALKRNGRDPRALNGLDQVIDRLLTAAEAELQQQHLDAAQQLTEQARAIRPDHARVAFLAAQIGAQRESAVLNKAQRAAAGGDVAGALATLEDAAHGEHRSTLVEEARAQLAQKQLRVADYLNRGHAALERGDLVAPEEDNARFYIESARALAPGDAAVQQSMQQLITRLQDEARQALAARNAEQAELWIAAAAGVGADPVQVSALRSEAQQLRSGARGEDLTRLSAAFNERLEHGALLDPATDSAHFYLTQLMQQAADDPATRRARSAYGARVLDEARNALRAQDLPGTRRWLTEARAASAEAAGIAALDAALAAAQDEAQHAASYVDASSLARIHYVAPQFPDIARARGIDGWVDLQFIVGTDGAVGDVAVVGAQPAGIFEQAALDAVRRWRYQPVLHDGQTVSQHARVRLRFTVQR